MSTRTLELVEVDARTFAAALDRARNTRRGAYLSPYTTAECAHMRCLLDLSGRAGGALKVAEDGTLEAVAIFNVGAPGGTGRAILERLRSMGAKRLDCLGEGLRDLYESQGWRVTETLRWDDRYAPENWHPEDGRPNVYVMEA